MIPLICQSIKQCVEDEKDVIHYDVSCNVCGTEEVVGILYECGKCGSGFDVCSQCKNVHTQEYPSHELRKVTESKPYHIGYTCGVCKEYPIGGVRYRCKVCHDFDLCGKCKQSGKQAVNSKHRSEHEMEPIDKVELHKDFDDLRINPPRKITIPDDFEIDGLFNALLDQCPIEKWKTIIHDHLGINSPFNEGNLGILMWFKEFKWEFMLKLQSFVRQDMPDEILRMLEGNWYDNETCNYIVLPADFDGALKAKFDLPIHASKIKSHESCGSTHVECMVGVTALQLAVITKSSRSINAIMDYMLRPKATCGSDRSLDEIMDSIVLAFAEKVQLQPDQLGNYKKEHISLRDMNVFHLAAKYHPLAIEMIHRKAENGIIKLFTEKCMPKTHSEYVEYIDSLKEEPVNVECPTDSTSKVFDANERDKINEISRIIAKEDFDPYDPFVSLKRKTESFRKSFIKLQLLLGRQNYLKETPLHVAVQGEHKTQLSAVE